MKHQKISLTHILLLGLTFLSLSCQKETTKETIKSDTYELEINWPNLPEEFNLGNPTGLGIDSNGDILVFHRANRVWEEPMPKTKIQENTIITLDKQTGEILKNWGADLFIMPHGLKVDKENNIWVTDVALHQIFKFNSDGNLLLTLMETCF